MCPGQRQKDVIKARAVDGHSSGGSPRTGEPGECGVDVGSGPVGDELNGAKTLIGTGGAQAAKSTFVADVVGELEAEDLGVEACLQVVAAALGDDPTGVEEGDGVGQLIGFFEVLGREQDGDPVVD